MPHATTPIERAPDTPAEVRPVVGQGALTLPKVGELWLRWTERGVRSLGWTRLPELPGVKTYRRLPSEIAKPLKAYAKGEGVDPARAIEADLVGTAFQKKVWATLRTIEHGHLRTYAGIAADIGKPRASRAVGAANGRNPVPIIVPCHRVVGCGHTLGGFSAGLDRKRALLRLEGVRLDGDRLLPGQLTLF